MVLPICKYKDSCESGLIHDNPFYEHLVIRLFQYEQQALKSDVDTKYCDMLQTKPDKHIFQSRNIVNFHAFLQLLIWQAVIPDSSFEVLLW